MAKEELVFFNGRVLEVFRNAWCDVELENGLVVKAYVAGKMRKNKIHVVANDKVKVGMSHYDFTKGIIVERY